VTLSGFKMIRSRGNISRSGAGLVDRRCRWRRPSRHASAKMKKKLDGAGGGERLAVRPAPVLWRAGGVFVASSVRWRGGAVATAARGRRRVLGGTPTIHERQHVDPGTLVRPQAAATRPPPAGDGAASSRRQPPASYGGQPELSSLKARGSAPAAAWPHGGGCCGGSHQMHHRASVAAPFGSRRRGGGRPAAAACSVASSAPPKRPTCSGGEAAILAAVGGRSEVVVAPPAPRICGSVSLASAVAATSGWLTVAPRCMRYAARPRPCRQRSISMARWSCRRCHPKTSTRRRPDWRRPAAAAWYA